MEEQEVRVGGGGGRGDEVRSREELGRGRLGELERSGGQGGKTDEVKLKGEGVRRAKQE